MTDAVRGGSNLGVVPEIEREDGIYARACSFIVESRLVEHDQRERVPHEVLLACCIKWYAKHPRCWCDHDEQEADSLCKEGLELRDLGEVSDNRIRAVKEVYHGEHGDAKATIHNEHCRVAMRWLQSNGCGHAFGHVWARMGIHVRYAEHGKEFSLWATH